MSREALQDLQRRWGSLRGARREDASFLPLEPREAPGRRCSVWPERVTVVPADLAGAALPLEPVGRAAPVARLLGPTGLPFAWAAVEAGGLSLAVRPGDGPLWVQLSHEGFQYPAPGAEEYALGPTGLAARVLRHPHAFEVLLANQGARAATFRLSPRADWLDLDYLEASLGPGEARPLRGRIRSGSRPPAGARAEVEVHAAGRRIGEVLVEVGPWTPTSGLTLRCVPEDLGLVGAAPVSLQVHLACEAPLRGVLHVGLLPHPVVREFHLKPGAVHRETFEVAPDTLPRIERGRLRILALTDATRPDERTLSAQVPFRRLKLRRNVPRVRLAPSRTNPYPHQEVSLRRSDGGPVRLTWSLSPDLEPTVQVRSDREGRLLVWCHAAPEAMQDGEIRVKDGETGLEETIPVRVEGRSRR